MSYPQGSCSRILNQHRVAWLRRSGLGYVTPKYPEMTGADSICSFSNHLLYSVLGYYVYSALMLLGLKLRAIAALQAINAIASAGAAFLIYRWALRFIGSVPASLCCMLLFAFGATW